MSKEKQMGRKILILCDRMGDYHRARWRALSALIGEENCVAADLGAGDGLYQWDNTDEDERYFRLSNQPVEQAGVRVPFRQFKRIVKEQQIKSVCIPGYGRMIYLVLLLYCKINGIETMLFAESWYQGSWLFDKLKGLFIRLTVDSVFVSGKRAAAHFNRRLNYPSQRIIEGYSVVDNQHFSSSDKPAGQKKELLCVARFVPEKNLEVLIDAFLQSKLTATWRLKIVGGGPLREVLEQKSQRGRVILSNWLKYDELPDLYREADCFILPSRFEPWGLVVNEAMAAGLPIILSDQVGALPDLLHEGENGWLFQHDLRDSLVDVLNELSWMNNEQLQQMGEESKKIIKNYSVEKWAEKIVTFTNQNQRE